jgi:16S rRNA (uracil1498-N3)-methyltransferase
MSKPLRLFVTHALAANVTIEATEEQAHYLLNVMRRKAGDNVLLFNGRDGEWQATLSMPAKRRAAFAPVLQTRPQTADSDVWLAFAPVKRNEFLVEKASELGVAVLLPVFTRHTDAARVNVERLRANAIEAAEQCERLSVPTVHDAVSFDAFLASWPPTRTLFFLDETGGGMPINTVLNPSILGLAAGFLTGPEGGFAQSELDALRQLPFARPVGLGPRVLRAETAALAALACWQALVGDWAPKP